MKTTDIYLLCQIFGTVQALYWLPLLRSLGARKNSVASWQVAYRKRGLPFGVDRPTTEALRRLTADGLLATSGATQGKSHRLTDAGLFVAMDVLDYEMDPCFELLAKIRKLEKTKGVCFPRTETRIVMCWELIPSAGKWLAKANATEVSWRTYQDTLLRFAAELGPLLMDGVVKLTTDHGGRLWGVTSTGENPSAPLPPLPPPPEPLADSEESWSAWERGYDNGVAFCDRPAPAGFDNIVAYAIPASGWC